MTLELAWILAVYVLASIITFLAYGWDKRRAIHHHRRISERTLHLMELLGGWPGALVAQRHFRHKWKKAGYMIRFWCIALIHMLGWIVWCAH